MKKLIMIALFIIGFAASASPMVTYAQPVCGYPAQWVWRGYWNCEYPAPVYYPPTYYYPYYGYPYGYYGGYVGGVYPRGGGYYSGGGHVSGGFRGGGDTPVVAAVATGNSGESAPFIDRVGALLTTPLCLVRNCRSGDSPKQPASAI